MNKKLYNTIINCNTGLIVVVAENKMAVFNFSGSLKNNFDKDKVQSEIDLQVKVTKEFRSNVQHFQAEQNKRKDELKAKLERNEISQKDYDEQISRIQKQSLLVNMIAGGLTAPSDSVLGVATSTVSPAVSFQVGQHFKKEGKEGSFEHIATHAVIGALTSAANGGNALSGAVSAGGAEYIAQVTAQTLFKKDANELTADEKQTVSSIAQIVATVSGSLNGDSSLDAYVGGIVATNAVDNNLLNPKHSWTGNYLTEKSANKKTSVTVSGDKEIMDNLKKAENCAANGNCSQLVGEFSDYSRKYLAMADELDAQGKHAEANKARELAQQSSIGAGIAASGIKEQWEIARNKPSTGRTTVLGQFSENWNTGEHSLGLSSKSFDYWTGTFGVSVYGYGFKGSFMKSNYDDTYSIGGHIGVIKGEKPQPLSWEASISGGEIYTDNKTGRNLTVAERHNKGFDDKDNDIVSMKTRTANFIKGGSTSFGGCLTVACGNISHSIGFNEDGSNNKAKATEVGVSFAPTLKAKIPTGSINFDGSYHISNEKTDNK